MDAGLPIDLALYVLSLSGPVLGLRGSGWFKGEPLALWTVGLVLGLFAVPTLAYFAATLAHTHITKGLLLGASAGLCGLGWALGALGRRRSQGTA